MGWSRIKRLRGSYLVFNCWGQIDYSRLCDAEYNRWEENRLSALRALQVCRAVGPFAERFKPQLTIRAKPCHGDMGGVLLLKLPLFGLNAGIPLRIKRLGIDFAIITTTSYAVSKSSA